MVSIFAIQICCGEQIKETANDGHNCIGKSIDALCSLRNAPDGLIDSGEGIRPRQMQPAADPLSWQELI
jgi:hypothetical protein